MESTQEREFLDILEELKKHEPCISDIGTTGTRDERLQRHFCSDTVFNLSNRVLSENKIKLLEKGLDFAPIHRKINEPELRKDFEEFCRRIRTKWNFRNKPSQDFSVTPAFARKSSWKPPLGHPNLQVFLSQVESELFIETQDSLRYSNLSQEEWRAVRYLADDRSIVIKKGDKGSRVVVWDRWDYIKEAEKQVADSTVYKEINYNKKILSQLVDSSNKYVRKFNSTGYISYKEMKYFTHEYKKACNLGKLYLLSKIHVPGRPDRYKRFSTFFRKYKNNWKCS